MLRLADPKFYHVCALPLLSDMHNFGRCPQIVGCIAAEEGKPGASQPELPADAGAHTIERLDKLRNSTGGLSVAQIRSNLQKTMQADAAVFRSQVRFLT